MRFLWFFAINIFCLPLWAEEEEVWPELPVNVFVGASPERLIVTADMTIANIRFWRDSHRKTDKIAMSYRVIGKGTKCLQEVLLLGIEVDQFPSGLFSHPIEQRLFFQVHYLTKSDSVRYFHPLAANKGWEPLLEIEKLHIGQVRGMELLLRGELSPSDIDIGIGLARRIGDHIEIRAFTNDPKIEVFFKYNLLKDH